MMPKFHILLGLAFSSIIFYFFPSINIFGFFVIWLSSIFIDLDHAVRYSIKTKNFNPIKFWKWSIIEGNARKNLDYSKYKFPIFFLHGIEFILILILLSFLNKVFLFILIGVLFHLFLDYIDLIIKHEPLLMKLSLVGVLITNKNKKDFNFQWQKTKKKLTRI